MLVALGIKPDGKKEIRDNLETLKMIYLLPKEYFL